jgi:hypothetical protein
MVRIVGAWLFPLPTKNIIHGSRRMSSEKAKFRKGF